jgi:hypothetical protein
VFAFVLAWVAWIYLPDLPNGPDIVIFAVVVALFAVAQTPVNPFYFVKPFLIGFLLTVPVYLFVLPWLTTPYGLFAFLVLFALPWGYLGSRGQMNLKFFVMLSFLVGTGINNAPAYSFSHLADIFLLLTLAIVVPAIAFVLLPSSQPEKAFLRSLRVFFKSCASFVDRRTFHTVLRQERFPQVPLLRKRVDALPPRLKDLCEAIPLDSDDRLSDQMGDLLDAIQRVAYRLRVHEDERDRAVAQGDDLFLEIQAEGAELRDKLGDLFRAWARLEKTSDLGALRSEYQSLLAKVENRLYDKHRQADRRQGLGPTGVNFSVYAASHALMDALRELEEAMDAVSLRELGSARV